MIGPACFGGAGAVVLLLAVDITAFLAPVSCEIYVASIAGSSVRRKIGDNNITGTSQKSVYNISSRLLLLEPTNEQVKHVSSFLLGLSVPCP